LLAQYINRPRHRADQRPPLSNHALALMRRGAPASRAKDHLARSSGCGGRPQGQP
jgi:hypothetical protein